VRRRTFIALATVFVALGLLVSACGGKVVSPLPSKPTVGTLPTVQKATLPAAYKGGDATAGKQVFLSAGCTGCHTLKDAGSTGTVGPNLDQLKPSFARVKHQVEVGGGPMPAFKGQLTGTQINDVAAFVSSSAGP
jgi:mono/diheme cytochrome c family protein